MATWRGVNELAARHPLVADAVVVVVVWGMALLDGGTIAAIAAEILTIGAVARLLWRWGRRRLPRMRADEVYIRVLWRSLFSTDQTAAGSAKPAAGATGAAWRLSIPIVIGVFLSLMSVAPHAPATDALPLMPGAGVVASASGGDQISTANPGRFRYIVIVGPAGMSGSRFLSSEVGFLIAEHWSHLSSWIFRGDASTPRPVPITTPGASAELDSPDGSIYVALDAITNPQDAAQDTSGSPLSGNNAVAQDAGGLKPTLWITLGNGAHR